MTVHPGIVIVVLACVLCCSLVAEESKTGTASTENNARISLIPFPIKSAGTRLSICILIVNDGDRRCSYWTESMLTDFKIEAAYQDGRPVPQSTYWKNYQKRVDTGGSSAAWVNLAPGQMHLFTLILDRLFDTSVDDDYRITVSKIMRDENKKEFTVKCSWVDTVKNSDPMGRDLSDGETLYKRAEAFLEKRKAKGGRPEVLDKK